MRPTVCVAALSASTVALGLAGCGSPAAKASPTTTFASKRYGYSITLPGRSGRWLANLAVRDWKSGIIGGTDSPEFDKFTDSRSSRNYLVAAVPGRWNLSAWTYFAKSARSGDCEAPDSLPDSTLGGEQARVLTWTCSDGYRIVAATALHARRGYFMLVISPVALSRKSDLGAFQTARQSFRFLHA